MTAKTDQEKIGLLACYYSLSERKIRAGVMASDGVSKACRSDSKRKLDDAQHNPRTETRGSYNTVPPPLSDFELVKQRVQQIAARLVAQDTKRSRTEGVADDENVGRSSSNDSELDHRVYQEQHHALRQQGGGHDSQSETRYDSFQEPIQFRKVDVPNSKVGLIIGRGGETIKYLQHQSGAKIQVARDAESDSNAPSRHVELTGFPDQLAHAEELIKNVIAEANSRGSSSFVAPSGEQLHVKIPTSKVGLIIGKGGETIRSLQSKSGAHIQLVPLQGEEASFGVTERTLTLTGTKNQTQTANDMIKEVISEYRGRGPPMSGGYHQQAYRPPGPPGQWGPPGPPPAQQGYGYQQASQYPGPPQQYPPPPSQYGGYSQQLSSDYEWNHPPPAPHQPQPNYYNQQVQAAGTFYGPQGGGYNQDGSYGHKGYKQQGSNTDQGYGQQGFVQSGYASESAEDYGPPGSCYQPSYGQQPDYGQQGSTPQEYGHQLNYGQQEVARPSYTQQGPMTQACGQENSPQQDQADRELTKQTNPGSVYNEQGYGQQLSSQQSHGQQGSTQQAFGQQGSGQQDHEQPASAQLGYLQQGLSQKGRQQRSVEYGQQGSNQPVYGQQGSAPQIYASQGAAQSSYGQQGTSQQGSASQSLVIQGSGQSAYGTRGQQGSPLQGYADQGAAQAGCGQQGPGQHESGHSRQGAQSGCGQQVPTQHAGGQQRYVARHGHQSYEAKYGYSHESYHMQPNEEAGNDSDDEYNGIKAPGVSSHVGAG